MNYKAQSAAWRANAAIVACLRVYIIIIYIYIYTGIYNYIIYYIAFVLKSTFASQRSSHSMLCRSGRFSKPSDVKNPLFLGKKFALSQVLGLQNLVIFFLRHSSISERIWTCPKLTIQRLGYDIFHWFFEERAVYNYLPSNMASIWRGVSSCTVSVGATYNFTNESNCIDKQKLWSGQTGKQESHIIQTRPNKVILRFSEWNS